jgi:hypothetical protein
MVHHIQTQGGENKKIKLKNNKSGLLCDQTKSLPLVFFLKIFVVLLATSKLQGLGLVWVQLPKEFMYTKTIQKH